MMDLNCPVCKEVLSSGKDHYLCPKGHGIFLTLQNFRQATSFHFVNWVYAHWLHLVSPRKNHCPACLDLMISLHNEADRRFDFEFCPSCFGLWMSSEKETELLTIFRTHEDIENLIPNPTEVFGKIIYEHENILMKYEALTQLGKSLSWRPRRYR